MSAADATGIALSGAELRRRREELGLTRAELAWDAGISEGHVRDLERGRSGGSTGCWVKIRKALGMAMPERLPRKLKREFEPGVKYRFIPDTRTGLRDLLPNPLDDVLRLRYLRKEGAHHVFQSRGGWLMSWTDAQLVGWEVAP